ncbi:hypothetical protein LTR85_011692 [Meristemomyces frigidus]|nr:hypothetical protein LTR85_011692 [Meristemomyces frigidus]
MPTGISARASQCEQGSLHDEKDSTGSKVQFKVSCNDFRLPMDGNGAIIDQFHANILDECWDAIRMG